MTAAAAEPRARHRPVWALHVLVVGLALHNLVMAQLWEAGVRGSALDVVAAWKDVLVVVALLLAIRARGRLPFDGLLTDWLAIAFAGFVVLYAVLPQSWLGGAASANGVLLGLRHDGMPVAAYFLGRALGLDRDELRRVLATIVATAFAVAAFGLVDVYAVSLQWWRDSAADWFTHQLGFDYLGLSGLPENFVYNTGDEQPLRRLVSTFLSPLATSYLLVIGSLVAAAWIMLERLRGRMLALWLLLVTVLFAGLLWTHSRSSYLALALGLAVLAFIGRAASRTQRRALVAAAFGVVVVGAAFVRVYPDVGPKTSFTDAELVVQRENAKRAGDAVDGLSDASTESHWRSLRAGVRTVLRHPQGFGLGNAGSTASRTDTEIQAGESTYTELGVSTGLLGGLVFVAWCAALLWRIRRAALITAAFAAVLALGLQTDVIGVQWVACVVWALAGSCVRARDDAEQL